MSIQIETTIHDGEQETKRSSVWGGTKQRLVGVLQKEYGLNSYQRNRLLAKGLVKVKKKETEITIELKSFTAPPRNSRQGQRAFMIRMEDGTEINWNALPDDVREGMKLESPELYAQIEESIAKADAALKEKLSENPEEANRDMEKLAHQIADETDSTHIEGVPV